MVTSVNAHQQSFTSSGNDFCRHAFLVEVRCVSHESAISRQSLQRYTLADAVQTCSGVTTPNGMREKYVVAQTRSDVYLASLDMPYLCRFRVGVRSSRYEEHIVTTYGRSEGFSGQSTRLHRQRPGLLHNQRLATRESTF